MTNKFTEALAYAIDFANKMERKNGYEVHTVNTLFIGILKLTNKVGKTSAARDEIKKLNDKISVWGKEADEIRWALQEKLPKTINVEAEKKAFDKVKNALPQNASIIDSIMMLDAIMKNKTPEIKSILEDVEIPEEKNSDAGSAEKADTRILHFDDKTGADFIRSDADSDVEKLVEITKYIREELMSKVYGQNHAIHNFVDGLWNSELIAMSDENRKRPRGVFLFAGPAGVGKTFLAEEAAKLMRIPFLRLDMSAYSYRDSVVDLTGFAKTYKDSRRGLLTEYVANNPRCFILFDEIEKAHPDVIQLFLQILDAGVLTELYNNEKVSFKDVTIVFTTNAGRDLYESTNYKNAAILSEKKIVEALETDINPKTNLPYFPTAIISRISAGSISMFNHLEVQDLEKVCRNEFEKVAKQVGSVFDLDISADEQVYASLLFSEGGKVDARNLTVKTGKFIREEIKKIVSLFNESTVVYSLKKFDKLRFKVELDKASDTVKKFYSHFGKTRVLCVGMVDGIPRNVKKYLNDFEIIMVDDMEEALDVLEEKDVDMLLLQIDSEISPEDEMGEKDSLSKTKDFGDFMPIGSSDISKRRGELVGLHKKYPELPIYILETSYFAIDKELENSLVQCGARGIVKLYEDYKHVSGFAKRLKELGIEIHVQNQAKYLKKHSKVLNFETAPIFDKEKNEIVVRLREFSLEQIISNKDEDAVVSESENITVRFDDIIGAKTAKEELTFFMDYLKNPSAFIAQGFKAPKGVLLYGMPGTGKTMLAKALAGEAGVAFLSTEGSAFVNQYVGSGPAAVRSLFAKARKYAPSIVFIDEIDVIGRMRTGAETTHAQEETLTALLTEMDGVKVDPKRPVFVLAATNYDVDGTKGGIGVLDAALARRFDRAICVELPDKDARALFLKKQLQATKYVGSESLIKDIADRSIGMSLANLEKVVEFAKRAAMRKNTNITDEILDNAFEEIVHGEKHEWGHDLMERVARHEAGHAVISYNVNKPVSYITIVARGNHGGYVQNKDEQLPILTKNDLLNEIRILLGGRAAEIAYYGEEEGLSTGVSSDLKKATRIAKQIVCELGMIEECGYAVIDEAQLNNPYYSELVYKKVNELIKNELEKAVVMIKESKEVVDCIVEKLLDKNQLNAHELEDIMMDFE